MENTWMKPQIAGSGRWAPWGDARNLAKKSPFFAWKGRILWIPVDVEDPNESFDNLLTIAIYCLSILYLNLSCCKATNGS